MADAFIEVYEGLLGGGKTYSVVRRLFMAACEGRTIITNIGIHWDQWKTEARKRKQVELEDDQYIQLNPENVENFDKHVKRGTRETPVIMALDEIHLFFNARDWSQTNKNKRGILELLTQARKINLHLILITQHRNNLDKQFVRMVQYYWRCRDLKKWDIPIGPFRIKYPFSQILQICTQSENENVIVRKRYIPKESWVFALYSTADLAKNLDVGGEVVDKKSLKKVEKPAGRRGWFTAGVLAGLSVMCFVGFHYDRRPVDVLENSAIEDIAHSQEPEMQPTASEDLVQEQRVITGIYSLGGKLHVNFRDHGWMWFPVSSCVVTTKEVIINGKPYPIADLPALLEPSEKAFPPHLLEKKY